MKTWIAIGIGVIGMFGFAFWHNAHLPPEPPPQAWVTEKVLTPSGMQVAAYVVETREGKRYLLNVHGGAVELPNDQLR
jgi:hypothetical protein